MNCNIELRYIVPILIFLLINSQAINPLDHHGGVQVKVRHQHSSIPSILLVAILSLLFLFTSIKIPLDVTLINPSPIRFQAGDFSTTVAASFLCSILLPHPYFWSVYSIILCISPWNGSIMRLLKCFISWLYHSLQEEEHSEEAEQPQVESFVLEMEEQTLQEPPNLEEQNFVAVVDGET